MYRPSRELKPITFIVTTFDHGQFHVYETTWHYSTRNNKQRVMRSFREVVQEQYRGREIVSIVRYIHGSKPCNLQPLED